MLLYLCGSDVLSKLFLFGTVLYPLICCILKGPMCSAHILLWKGSPALLHIGEYLWVMYNQASAKFSSVLPVKN